MFKSIIKDLSNLNLHITPDDIFDVLQQSNKLLVIYIGYNTNNILAAIIFNLTNNLNINYYTDDKTLKLESRYLPLSPTNIRINNIIDYLSVDLISIYHILNKKNEHANNFIPNFAKTILIDILNNIYSQYSLMNALWMLSNALIMGIVDSISSSGDIKSRLKEVYPLMLDYIKNITTNITITKDEYNFDIHLLNYKTPKGKYIPCQYISKIKVVANKGFDYRPYRSPKAVSYNIDVDASITLEALPKELIIEIFKNLCIESCPYIIQTNKFINNLFTEDVLLTCLSNNYK